MIMTSFHLLILWLLFAYINSLFVNFYIRKQKVNILLVTVSRTSFIW